MDERGRAVPGRHPLAPDPLGDAHCVVAIHHDRAAAGLGREQGGEHLHVEDREREEVALAEAGVVAPTVHEGRAGDEQVVLAVQRALREAGRPARVRDACRRVRVDVVRERFVGCALDRVAPLVDAVAAHDHDPDAGDVMDLCCGVRIAEEQRGLTVLEQVALLGGREDPVDADPHRAESHRSVERGDHLDVVRQRSGDTMTTFEAQVAQRVGRAVGERVQLPVRPPARPRDDRLARRVDRQHRVEDVGHRARDRHPSRAHPRKYRPPSTTTV